VGAAEDWARDLASWAIPPDILAKAPRNPWGWPIAQFVRATEQAMTFSSPSLRRAREALAGDGGSVLDVGCGAGAASLPLCPPAGSIVGVDESAEMLAAFDELARARGIDHHTVRGRWPDVSGDVSAADVVVSNHVLYNVGDIEPFVVALADHSRERTVIEITSEHPRAWHAPLWRALHGIDRPTKPTVDDLVIVLAELGIEAGVERWMHPTRMRDASLDEEVALVRAALCLNADRDLEIAAALRKHPPPAEREIATLWWDRDR